MLETYRGIPHLLDTWLVLTGMTLPVALSSFRRPGDLVPRLAAFCLPAAFALVIAPTTFTANASRCCCALRSPIRSGWISAAL